jgi:hypothetical protein
MMKKSKKLVVTGAASLLGVALAASGAYAATGSLTAGDAPGQVLHVSGVGPASDHASATAVAHANAKAKGLFGSTSAHAAAATHASAKGQSGAVPVHASASANGLSGAMATPMAAGHSSVGQVARPAPQTLPAYHAVMPHMPATVQPVVPQPMMSRATTVPSGPMMH